MKVVEAYNSSQIRACGSIIEELKNSGESIENFLKFVKAFKRPENVVRNLKFHLKFIVDSKKVISSEDMLLAVGYENLKSYRRLYKEFAKRDISEVNINTTIKDLRSLSLSSTRWGAQVHKE